MKIIARFQEFPKTEILLFKVPIEHIEWLLREDPNIGKKIQEYKPRKFIPSGQKEPIMPNLTLRHQIVLEKEVPGILKIKLYSHSFSAKEVRGLKLEPIESVEKKEKLEKALKILHNSESRFSRK